MACGYGSCHGCAVRARRAARSASASRGPSSTARGSRRERADLVRGRARARAPACSTPRARATRWPHWRPGLPVHEDLAAIVTKTVTPLPRAGNPAPRVAESAGWLLNSIGLANPGIERLRARGAAGRRSARPCRSSSRSAASAPPTTPAWPLPSRARRRSRSSSTSRARTSRPAAPRSAPTRTRRAPSSRPAGRAARCRCGSSSRPASPTSRPSRAPPNEGGADALVLTNTARGLALDPWTLEPALGGGTGGLSGPPLRPLALAAVRACRAAVALPIVGVGGIVDGADAIQFLAAGAAAVEVGTALFREPRAARRVRAEMRGRPPRARPRAGGPPIAQTLDVGSRLFQLSWAIFTWVAPCLRGVVARTIQRWR